MTQDELKLVLDALKWCHGGEPCGTAEAIAVVEKALAQPEQEPVGEVYGWHGHGVGQPLCRFNVTESDMPVGSLLYTTPPQRTTG